MMDVLSPSCIHKIYLPVQRFAKMPCQDCMMKTIQLLLAIAFAVCLPACSKNSNRRIEVNIRVANASGESIQNFQLNTTDFGSIADDDTSVYKTCYDVLPIAFANAISINNQASYIVDIVPTPYLTSGSYTLRLVPDSVPWRYNGIFIKE